MSLKLTKQTTQMSKDQKTTLHGAHYFINERDKRI